MAKEYASLKTAGFDDDDEINDLINKRWSKMQELKKATDSDGGGNKGKAKNVTEEVEIPVFLTEAQAAKSNLKIKSPEPNDKGMYIYTRITGGSAAKDPTDDKRKTAGERKTGPPLKVEPAVKIEGKEALQSYYRNFALLQEVTKAACNVICGALTVAHTSAEISPYSVTSFYKVGVALGLIGAEQIMPYHG